MEAMKGVLYHDPEEPRKVNPRAGRALSAVCMKALNKDPLRRYPTARELASDIRLYREFLPVSAARPRLIDRVYNWSRRRPKLASVLATMLFVFLVIAAGLSTQAFIEKHLIEEVFEELENRTTEIKRLDGEINVLREKLPEYAEDSLEYYRLGEAIKKLEARRDIKRSLVKAKSWGILGLTFFKPDERAQRIVREDLLNRIKSLLQSGEYTGARTYIDAALRTYEKRRNLHGFSPADIEWLLQQRAEADAQIRKEEKTVIEREKTSQTK